MYSCRQPYLEKDQAQKLIALQRATIHFWALCPNTLGDSYSVNLAIF
jgi:hypothetical protein